MRRYTFHCYECGHQFEIIDDNSIASLPCESCGKVCTWNRIVYGTKQRGRHAECEGFFSDTMGVHPDQVADEKKRHPNWKFNDSGQLWIENLKDQRQKCRVLGMVGFDDIQG